MEQINLSQRDAQRILKSLREAGLPPIYGARLLSVGLEDTIKNIREEYLQNHLTCDGSRDGSGVVKYVVANYGGGKTLLLFCIREESWDNQYVVAHVELNQDECPLDNPALIFSAVARSIQASPSSVGDIDREGGLDRTLEHLLDKMFPGVLSGTPDDRLKDEAITWVHTTLSSTSVESIGFREAVCRHLLAKLNSDEAEARKTTAFLRGENISASDLSSIGVFERLDKSNGLRMLRSMCQLFQRSGLAAGTILLFDEARRSLSLMSAKAQRVACENLLTITNQCNQSKFPGTMLVFAVMPEFFTDFVTNYPALQGRTRASSRIDLEDLAIKEPELLSKIGTRVTELFEISEGSSPDAILVRKNLKLIAEAAIKQSMGTGTRRLFSMAWTNALYDLSAGEAKVFGADDIERYVKEAADCVVERDQSLIEAEGE